MAFLLCVMIALLVDTQYWSESAVGDCGLAN